MQNHQTLADATASLTAIATCMAIIGIIFFAAWLWSLIDVIKSDFKEPSNKTMWIILLLIVPPLATILYEIFGKKQKLRYIDPTAPPRFIERGRGPSAF